MYIINKLMKTCSISPLLREIQIKTLVRYYLMPARITVIRKKKRELKLLVWM